MKKPALNKSALGREKKRYNDFKKYLPSLELKQKQLLAERKNHQLLLEENRAQLEKVQQNVYSKLPMLAIKSINLSGLVKISNYELETENLLGTKLPKLARFHCERTNYSFLTKPHWVDEVANALELAIELELLAKILGQRIIIIEKAAQTITQRVNLFSKVLMPNCKHNIKRISLFLADQDRAAVVRSKIAKQKHQKQVVKGELQ